MSRGEDYLTISATIEGRTERAVLLKNEDVAQAVWVPRSTLHFASDEAVKKARIGDELTLQVMRWVVEREGLG